VTGVSQVNDMMSVDQSEPEATFYTVVSGDNLSKIAKQHYDNPNKYMLIFEANKPMLSHPDKIYPGPGAAHSAAVDDARPCGLSRSSAGWPARR
jgi:LysM repeat protein